MAASPYKCMIKLGWWAAVGPESTQCATLGLRILLMLFGVHFQLPLGLAGFKEDMEHMGEMEM